MAGMDRPMHAAEMGHAACVELLAEREGGMKTTREWCGYPLAQQPSTSQRGGATLQLPPSSVASMLIPSCPIPSDPAGRSAPSSGAQVDLVGPHLQDSTEDNLMCIDLNVSSQIRRNSLRGV